MFPIPAGVICCLTIPARDAATHDTTTIMNPYGLNVIPITLAAQFPVSGSYGCSLVSMLTPLARASIMTAANVACTSDILGLRQRRQGLGGQMPSRGSLCTMPVAVLRPSSNH